METEDTALSSSRRASFGSRTLLLLGQDRRVPCRAAHWTYVPSGASLLALRLYFEHMKISHLDHCVDTWPAGSLDSFDVWLTANQGLHMLSLALSSDSISIRDEAGGRDGTTSQDLSGNVRTELAARGTGWLRDVRAESCTLPDSRRMNACMSARAYGCRHTCSWKISI